MSRLKFLAVALLALPVIAEAHITLEMRSAEAGSYYKAVFKVGHGCEGSPIREIVVQIPEGVVGAKPMPKPGWTLDVRTAPLAKPYNSHGKTIAEAPASIRWSGGSLPDAWYDEFVLVARLPEQPGTLYWKVSQVCDKGHIDWVEIPEAGKRPADYAAPAAVLEVTAKPSTPANHQH
jgi:periplasmic copper chaperone A